jgi:hypothetical protein
MNTDGKSGDRVIARDRENQKSETKNLPLLHTDDTDQKIVKIAEIAKDRRNWKPCLQRFFC